MTRFCNTKTPRLLAGIVTLLGVVAPATTVTAQAEVDPVAVFPVPGWSGAVERSIHNWNSTYGATVHAIGWADFGPIADGLEREMVVAEITDPAHAWFPSVDVADPEGATALQLHDDPGITGEQIDEWTAYVDSQVKVGQRKVLVEWFKEGVGPFVSLCLVDSRGIAYDNMFSFAAFGSVDPEEGKKCLDYRIGWAWQSDYKSRTRGHIRAYNNPTCRGGRVIACDYNCNDVSMTLGDAKIKCQSQQVTEDCCQLTYSWAWHTSGFKSIKVGADGFTLEIEGYIGSSSSGGGSCTVCCDESSGEGEYCWPDFNGDGLVDSRDSVEFLDAWNAGDPAADANSDGFVNGFDVSMFLRLWRRGCD